MLCHQSQAAGAAALISALTVAVISLASSTAVGLLYTVMLGSIAGRTWDDVTPAIIAARLTALSAALLTRRVEAVRLFFGGGSAAAPLGARPGNVRFSVLALATVVSSLLVVVCGPISFVARAAPHLARRALRQGRTSVVLVPAALSGAALITIADCLSRVVAAPGESPLSVATALIGGPVLLIVLRRIRA
ncbi:iron chelate uptake ABC transporter family permease subunit [Corynebacterium lactis]|uniref:iron chelate uptake ABC transporter family permease subunit n=1 Tax=Corynebacterium lactis TaxID=1231000 RepID=UPI0009EBB59E